MFSALLAYQKKNSNSFRAMNVCIHWPPGRFFGMVATGINIVSLFTYAGYMMFAKNSRNPVVRPFVCEILHFCNLLMSVRRRAAEWGRQRVQFLRKIPAKQAFHDSQRRESVVIFLISTWRTQELRPPTLFIALLVACASSSSMRTYRGGVYVGGGGSAAAAAAAFFRILLLLTL